MLCHHIYDPDTKKKVFIPYCWGGVIHGHFGCTCREVRATTDYNSREKELKKDNMALKKEIDRLNRTIRKLLKQ